MEICRICLRKSSSLAPLFKEKHGVGDRINEIFNFDFQIHSDTFPTFPQVICFDCLSDFYRASQFYENARSANHQLSMLLSTNEREIVSESPEVLMVQKIEIENEVVEDEIAEEEPCESQFVEVFPVMEDEPIEEREEFLVEEEVEEMFENQKHHTTIFSCDQCDKTYDKRSSYLYHQRTKHTNPSNFKFQCSVCNKKFAYNNDLIRHTRIHTNEKPFSCNYCGKQFTDRSTHLKHERIHSGIKMFQCDQCPKSFTLKFVLDNHVLTHTGIKNFICPECGKRFLRKSKMKDHFFRIHKRRMTEEDENRSKQMLENFMGTEKMSQTEIPSDTIVDEEFLGEIVTTEIDL